ncbi:hypothetical protein [Pantoea sp. BAV 3049]|uniref:hypothetical protein n=1 Tax=Pantoea sp. BAV 3049 TaxID=2654188 RepID=UPI00131E4C85|nr:hypothetical protein [Pantoea sp. BAV 3049]
MSVALIKWLLTRLLPGVLVCAALGGAGWWLHHGGYQSGFAAAKLTGDSALAGEKKSRADERQQLAQASNKALLDARSREQQQQQRADELALKLANSEYALQQASTLLGLQIGKAVSDDNKTAGNAGGCGFNGLGPRSLQLYEKALGYAGGGDASAGDRAGR